ncbi:centromere protein T [Varanus komodoensis]|uniref:centromere protein T n=1 Tax=Varanus komodoensis TaxID=61221 RepID=UPI001CF7EAA6|nr:centromere protein T [Varanus komodoensis]XP_044275759.1 centromere protein T [Varanus komodoensis]
MASRRSLRNEPEGSCGRRRSARLANKKDLCYGYQRSLTSQRLTASAVTDFRTPRTLLKKVLQTQPIVPPLAPEKPDSPKPAETFFQFPPVVVPCSDLEISFSDPAIKETSQIVLHKSRSKKVRLSEFERGLNKQLNSNAAHSLLINASMTKSLQISLTTPAPLHSAGKKGLIRRPKNYRGVNVKEFEGGIEQNLLQIKDSQSYLVDLQTATLLSNHTEMLSANTELFAHSQSSGQNEVELPLAHSQHALTGQSSANRLPSDQTTWENAESDMDVEEVTKSHSRGVQTPDAEGVDVMEATPEEEADMSREEKQESLLDAERELIRSHGEELQRPGMEHVGGLKTVPQERTVTLRRGQQESLHRNSHMEQSLSPEEHLTIDMDPVRSSTPADAKLLDMDPERSSTPADARLLDVNPGRSSVLTNAELLVKDPAGLLTPIDADLQKAQQGHLSALLHKKSARSSVKEMVVHIIKEMESSVDPAIMGQDIPEAILEEEPFPSERATHISQRTEALTLSSHISSKNPKQLEILHTKETVGGIMQRNSNEGKRRRLDEVALETEMDPEAEEISEAETDTENSEPTGKTPAFVRARAFQCSPLLSTPHDPKVTVSRSPSKQPLVKQCPRPTARARRGKHDPVLPSNLVRKIFSHYVGMPVTKDAFKVVEKCVNLYFKHLSNDLEAYTNHAKRKITEPADMELLMRRQGLVTDKLPLNVLIERHLPLEYRKLLIPVATSGNKVVPPQSR